MGGQLTHPMINMLTKTLLRKRTWLALLTCTLLAVMLSGCQNLSFYSQAVRGQYQIWANQRELVALIQDPATPETMKEKFRLVLHLRGYAEQELQLASEGQYSRFVDLHRRYVVWNVNAAPEFSLKPTSWWYPFVGRQKYRGYFSEDSARRYAADLARTGLDVHVGGVEAYSTLGWFHDPVLNTFIHRTEADLAEILFHELAHQQVFARGDTDFNEAFATAVAEEGVRRWLLASGNTNALERFMIAERRNEDFVRLVQRARAELKELYGETAKEGEPRIPGPKLSDTEKRAAKAQIIVRLRQNYEKLKADWGGYDGYDRWFNQTLNNAQLNTVAAYYDLVPGFRGLLQAHGGDLRKFYAEARNLAEVGKTKRHETLHALARSADPAVQLGQVKAPRVPKNLP
jgi:predicted aminopeptidase